MRLVVASDDHGGQRFNGFVGIPPPPAPASYRRQRQSTSVLEHGDEFEFYFRCFSEEADGGAKAAPVSFGDVRKNGGDVGAGKVDLDPLDESAALEDLNRHCARAISHHPPSDIQGARIDHCPLLWIIQVVTSEAGGQFLDGGDVDDLDQ
jgi:hypothetical protein